MIFSTAPADNFSVRAFPTLHLLLITCTILVLSACGRAPDDAALKTDLAAYVDGIYAPGLIDVVQAKRLDHRLFQWRLPDFARDRREVAFAADLKLTRDYDFGAWEQPNAAALMLLLGAKPEGLAGLKSGGNKAGDVIHAAGTVIYTPSDRGWRLAAAAPSARTETHMQSRQAALLAWRKVTAATLRSFFVTPPDEEISDVLKLGAARLGRRDGHLVVASGPRGQDYWSVTDAITHDGAAEQPSAALLNIDVRDSREALTLLRDGVATAALMRGDEAALAAQGQGIFTRDGTFPDLRALAALFPEPIHVIVKASSQIASVAELDGRRVAVVASGVAARSEAEDILRAHRVTSAIAAGALAEVPLATALDALARGERDAVILTAAAPAAALRDFASATPLRFLALDADAVALLTTGNSNYIAVTVPSAAYPGQERPLATVAVAALLVSTASVSSADAEAVLRRTFAGTDYMRLGSPLGALLKPATARRGITLALHPAAEAFFAGPFVPK